MIFEPVWISTIEHLKQFSTILTDTSTAIKRGVRFNVPDDFPQTRIELYWGLVRLPPSPLIIISNGTLDLHGDMLSYKAHPMDMKNNQVRNLNNELEFSISINEIISLEHHQFISPINKMFNISFARVHSTRDSLLQDILMCIGGQGLVTDKIRKTNESLFDVLSKGMENKKF